MSPIFLRAFSRVDMRSPVTATQNFNEFSKVRSTSLTSSYIDNSNMALLKNHGQVHHFVPLLVSRKLEKRISPSSCRSKSRSFKPHTKDIVATKDRSTTCFSSQQSSIGVGELIEDGFLIPYRSYYSLLRSCRSFLTLIRYKLNSRSVWRLREITLVLPKS
ncbi:hypothetical protein ACLB2K_020342 [Fragaria x ananassa]